MSWKFYMIWINVFFSLSENLEVIRVTSLLSPSKNMQFCNEQIRTSHYFHLHARAPPTAVPGCVDERIIVTRVVWANHCTDLLRDNCACVASTFRMSTFLHIYISVYKILQTIVPNKSQPPATTCCCYRLSADPWGMIVLWTKQRRGTRRKLAIKKVS